MSGIDLLKKLSLSIEDITLLTELLPDGDGPPDIKNEKETFVTTFTALMDRMNDLSKISESATYEQSATSSTDTKGGAATQVTSSVLMKDVVIPSEFIELVDSDRKISDPRMLLAFKKQTAFEEKERIKRCAKNLEVVSRTVLNLLEDEVGEGV